MAPAAVCTGNFSLAMKLRRRISVGSSPTSTANMSTARSIIWVASGRPAPRTGPIGVELETTEVMSTSILGMS